MRRTAVGIRIGFRRLDALNKDSLAKSTALKNSVQTVARELFPLAYDATQAVSVGQNAAHNLLSLVRQAEEVVPWASRNGQLRTPAERFDQIWEWLNGAATVAREDISPGNPKVATTPVCSVSTVVDRQPFPYGLYMTMTHSSAERMMHAKWTPRMPVDNPELYSFEEPITESEVRDFQPGKLGAVTLVRLADLEWSVQEYSEATLGTLDAPS